MEAIRKALRREIRLRLLASVALLLFGELLCIFAFRLNGAIVFVGIVLTILGIKLTRDAFLNQNVEKTALMQLLLYDPQKIVWIYSIVTQRMPFGLEFSKDAIIYFKLINGDEITITMSESETNNTLEMLRIKLPHVTFGYTSDREQWFMADPAMLYKEEGKQGTE